LAIDERKGGRAIARLLNSKKIKFRGDRKWSQAAVDEILTNPKYTGSAAWGRTTGVLGRRRVPVPREQWTVKAGAYVGLVTQETFDTAQSVLKDRTCHRSNEELLERLQKLLVRHKHLSQDLVNRHASEAASANTYDNRFGGMKHAYELIGYHPALDQKIRTKARRVRRRIETQILREIVSRFRNDAAIIRDHPSRRRIVTFGNGLKVSVLLCAFTPTVHGDARWKVRVLKGEKQYPTILCLCASNNDAIQEMYLVPKVDTTLRAHFRLREHDPWLKCGVRLTSLAKLKEVVDSWYR